MRSVRFQRGSPKLKAQPKKAGLVKIGGEWLSSKDAKFLSHYLRHFNGSRAAREIGIPDGTAAFAASDILRKPQVRSALRNALEQERNKLEVEVEQVARYWYDIATADPRELSQHIYVPCRCCWGIDHQYQFTDGELRSAIQAHRYQQLKLSEGKRTEFDELGGAGYTRNKYPMRGPDWIDRLERSCSSIGRPVPDGLEANSDHSCPECHGDGECYVWLADTRHLSPQAARLYSGVRITANALEIKTRNQAEAMDKFEQLTGMIKPRRPKLDFNLEELDTEALDALLEEARNRGLLSDEEVSRGVLIDATPSRSKALVGKRDDDDA